MLGVYKKRKKIKDKKDVKVGIRISRRNLSKFTDRLIDYLMVSRRI